MTNYSPLDLILFGGPASGKSTQAKLLVKKLKAHRLSMGELLRSIVANKGRDYLVIKRYIKAGKLVPGRIITRLVRAFVVETPKNKRIIFDGYPRKLSQIKMLEVIERKQGRSTVLIFIDLPLSVARDRICKRVKLEKRVDDTDSQVVSERIKIFKRRSKNVLAYYRSLGDLIKINGDQIIAAVQRDILKAIKSYESSN